MAESRPPVACALDGNCQASFSSRRRVRCKERRIEAFGTVIVRALAVCIGPWRGWGASHLQQRLLD